MTPATSNNIRILANIKDAYRGQGTDVSHLRNSPVDIAGTADLNWRVGQTPVGAIGKTQTKVIDGYKANVRSDNGNILGVVSDSYRPHHPAELLRGMTQFADAAGLQVVRAGHFGGGTHVWAAAQADVQGEISKGDVVRMRIVMRSSNDGTSASIYRAMAVRLVCLNGMTITESRGAVRFVHNVALSARRLDEVAVFMADTSDGFRKYLASIQRLRSIRSTPVIDRLMMLELVAPELLQQAHDRLHRISNTAPASSTPTDGASILGQMIQETSMRSDSLEVVQDLIAGSRMRTAKLLDNVLDMQAGSQYSAGHLDNLVQAVSAYQTHLRGEDATSVNGLMFTPGQDMARSAMDTATRWADTVESATR
jgi:hypothetical protein